MEQEDNEETVLTIGSASQNKDVVQLQHAMVVYFDKKFNGSQNKMDQELRVIKDNSEATRYGNG